jgi:diphthine-ammonia ligase
VISGVSNGDFQLKVAANWSGGKDCCLSLYNTVMQGYQVSTLLNFAFKDFEAGRWAPVRFSTVFKYMVQDNSSTSLKNTAHKASMLSSLALREVVKRTPRQLATPLGRAFGGLGTKPSNEVTNIVGAVKVNASRRMVPHEVSPEIVAMQARAMGVPIKQVPLNWVGFEQAYKDTVRKMNPKDVEGGVVWGMIPPDPVLDHPRKMKKYMNLKVQYDWINKLNSDLGVKAVMPLMGYTGERILTELVEKGFEVLVIVVNPDFVGEEWLGHTIDKDFINYMRRLNQEQGIHMAGDEFHSFVLDCPLFKQRIKVLKSKKISKDGYSIFDMPKAELVPKDKSQIVVNAS